MIYAWTFCRTDMVRPDGVTVPDDGIEQYDADRPLEMCRHGYHASIDIMNALQYAPGPILRRVRCSGEIIEGNDKLVCRRRTEIYRVDLTRVLREWACWCATRALEHERAAGREPDPRSWAAVDVALKYARGEATTYELAIAESAAWSASWSTAYYAAESAAWSAAGYAAYYAAESAAGYAAEYAACYATGYAAKSAERDIQRDELLMAIGAWRMAQGRGRG